MDPNVGNNPLLPVPVHLLDDRHDLGLTHTAISLSLVTLPESVTR